MAKRRKTQKKKGLFHILFYTALACFSAFLIWEGVMELKTMVELNNNIKETKLRIQELEEQKSEL